MHRTPEYAQEERKEHFWSITGENTGGCSSLQEFQICLQGYTAGRFFKHNLCLRVALSCQFVDNMSLRLMWSKAICKARMKIMNEEVYEGKRVIRSDIRRWSPACTHSLVVSCFPKPLMKTTKRYLTPGSLLWRQSYSVHPTHSAVLSRGAFYHNGAMPLYVFSYLWRDGYIHMWMVQTNTCFSVSVCSKLAGHKLALTQKSYGVMWDPCQQD